MIKLLFDLSLPAKPDSFRGQVCHYAGGVPGTLGTPTEAGVRGGRSAHLPGPMEMLWKAEQDEELLASTPAQPGTWLLYQPATCRFLGMLGSCGVPMGLSPEELSHWASLSPQRREST